MWDAIIITPFVNVLLFIYNLVGQNFGIAIILFTILIRLVTHPLTVQQLKGTQGMQKMQTDPRWIATQKKYKDDKEKLAQEQMKLYKEMGINPLGSCLPTVIQFPIIIGLYQTITRAMAASPLELLNLSKLVYPGLLHVGTLIPLHKYFLWMDLGKPDMIPLGIPGIPFGLPILAIIVVITTFLQSKLLTPPSSGNDQGAQMSKAMNLYMPFLMGYLAITLASGLSLYFVVSNVIGIAQYAALGKVNLKSLLPSVRKPSLKGGEAHNSRQK
jgi:YidC/Oxa1 family membrane protein insertase